MDKQEQSKQLAPLYVKKIFREFNSHVARSIAFAIRRHILDGRSRDVFPRGAQIEEVSRNIRIMMCYLNHAPTAQLENLLEFVDLLDDNT